MADPDRDPGFIPRRCGRRCQHYGVCAGSDDGSPRAMGSAASSQSKNAVAPEQVSAGEAPADSP
eukprot:5028536-Pleurochrysis_carterae.AAC.1